MLICLSNDDSYECLILAIRPCVAPLPIGRAAATVCVPTQNERLPAIRDYSGGVPLTGASRESSRSTRTSSPRRNSVRKSSTAW